MKVWRWRSRGARLAKQIAARFPAPSTLPNTVLLRKLRTDFPEFCVYTPASPDGINYLRWYFTNRFNTGNIGATRLHWCTPAKLYASSTQDNVSANVGTTTQGQAASASVATADMTFVGTWTAAATINGTTEVRYSTVTGDYAEGTITTAGTIFLRINSASGNGGIGVVTVRRDGVEIDAANYLPVAVSGERLISCANTVTAGEVWVPIAKDLPAGTYVVRVARHSSSISTYRLYVAGLRAIAAPSTTLVGVSGTVDTSTISSTTVARTFMPGVRVGYQFTGTAVIWNTGRTTNAGQARCRVYDSNGVEIGSQFYTAAGAAVIDLYSASSAIVSTKICTNLPHGTYYLIIESLGTKNASSTDYRFYDNGITALDERTAGVVGTDAFDDLGHTDTNPPPGNVLAGTGNQELAVKVRKTTATAGTETFVGGVHGLESAPASLVYSLGGSPIDFAAGALNAQWTGSDFNLTFTTELRFPDDSSAWASVAYDYTLSRDGYTSEFVRTVSVANALVFEDYAAMLAVPNRRTTTIGYQGGKNQMVAVPARQTGFYPSELDASNNIARADRFYWYNANSAAMVEILDWPEILTAYSQSGTADGLCFVQTRTDGFVKFYARAVIIGAGGVTPANGQVLTARKRYRVTFQ